MASTLDENFLLSDQDTN